MKRREPYEDEDARLLPLGRVVVRRVDDVDSSPQGELLIAEPVLDPEVEAIRLQYVRSLGAGFLQRHPRYDAVCAVIADLFQLDFAFVNIMDDKTAYITGLEGTFSDTQFDRNFGLGVLALLQDKPEVEVVEDMQEKGRFKQHPLVAGFPYLRFNMFCSATTSTGISLGAIGATATRPMQMSMAGCTLFANLASLLIHMMEVDHPAPPDWRNPRSSPGGGSSASADLATGGSSSNAAKAQGGGSSGEGDGASGLASGSVSGSSSGGQAGNGRVGSDIGPEQAKANGRIGQEPGRAAHRACSQLLLVDANDGWRVLYATDEWYKAAGRGQRGQLASTSATATLSSSSGKDNRADALPAFWDMYTSISNTEDHWEHPISRTAPLVEQGVVFRLFVREKGSSPEHGPIVTYECRPAATAPLYPGTRQLAINEKLNPLPELDAKLHGLYFAVLCDLDTDDMAAHLEPSAEPGTGAGLNSAQALELGGQQQPGDGGVSGRVARAARGSQGDPPPA